jgi:DNA-binding GntR family transcriptional regulator
MTIGEHITAVMRDGRLTSAEKCAAWMILDHLRSLNVETAEIPLKGISSAAHLSERKVRSACARLAELGYLIVRERRGRANLYSIPIQGFPGMGALVEPTA